MKIDEISVEPVTRFTPVKIKLTFQSQEELDAFGSLFNSSYFCAVVRQKYGETMENVFVVLYERLQSLGANIHNVLSLEDIRNDK